VSPAGATEDLRAAHEEAVVGAQLDRLGDRRLGEAGPAGAGLELRVGREQDRRAGGATVVARVLVVGVLPGRRRLRTGLEKDLVLGRRELLLPLLLGLHDLGVAATHAHVLAPPGEPLGRPPPPAIVILTFTFGSREE